MILTTVTEHKSKIDSAILRPGRLDIDIAIPMPDQNARCSVLSSLLDNMPHSIEKKDIELMAAKMAGLSTSVIINHVREVAMNCIRQSRDIIDKLTIQ